MSQNDNEKTGLDKQILRVDSRSKKLQSSKIDISDLKKLAREIIELNNVVSKNSIEKLDRNAFKSGEDYDKYKQSIEENYKISIFISGSRGEALLGQDETIFDKENIPDIITFVNINNSTSFENAFGRKPDNFLSIDFDFGKPKIFDYTVNPSRETINESKIEIYGANRTWAQGAFERILNILHDRQTKRAWFHKNNIYDFIIWFFIVPLIFVNFALFESSMGIRIQDTSIIIKVSFYVYAFFIQLFLFRLLFNYARWLWPYLE